MVIHIFESEEAIENFNMLVVTVKQTHQLRTSSSGPSTFFCLLGSCNPRPYYWATCCGYIFVLLFVQIMLQLFFFSFIISNVINMFLNVFIA